MSINIIHGNALTVPLEKESIDCCVTSPPYFGLRNYGSDEQIGLGQTLDEYIQSLVEVIRNVHRALRKDGTLWLNIADTYGTGTKATRTKGSRGIGDATQSAQDAVPRIGGMAKQLLGVPWRLAFALQDDGWFLRQDIVWAKSNPMPESVTDRCTKSHEYIFLLSKSPRYYFDHEAIKEPAVSQHVLGNKSHKGVAAYENGAIEHRTKQGLMAFSQRVSAADTFRRENSKRAEAIPGQTVGTHRPDRKDTQPNGLRNKRDVWTVAVRPFREAHFATFPPQLIEPCVLAGSRPGGTVLDPFSGAGTTGLVAKRLGRNYIGIELNKSYIDMSIRRIKEDK